MYEGQPALHIAGQIMIAILFLGTGAINATTKVKQHRDRMVDAGVPFAGPLLVIGFTLQFIGGLMLLFDYRTALGAAILIVFTLAASAIFHRFWLIEDPLRRHYHLSFLFGNCAVIGGLLLLM
ncbi:MAG: DoxX family protein [Rhizobiales bacterium]|nr:DoxX family protein [Hyphomicrobiales bacterium]